MQMINALVKTQHINKRHILFLTSAPIFLRGVKGGGVQLTRWPGLIEPVLCRCHELP